MTKIHYDVLRVQRTAPPEIIKRAYRKLCSEFHPDRNPEKDTTAAMQQINAAYAVLSDPDKKSVYDFQLRMDELMERLQPKPAREPPMSPGASSYAFDAEDDDWDFGPTPKRKPKEKTEKAAAEPKAEQQQAKLEALRVEVRRLCSIPPEFIRGEAGVLATRQWKKAAAKWHSVVSSESASIEVLTAARKAMLQAATVPAH
ncbi:J domain-containing protein [Paraburkholderia sediminicola]|uniref:J domain-containing protein n=1 Tax=Paraburkholderia sediminicola TaxID=458836 RepID=UPI0038B71FF2